jgi:hypothetical protein
MYATILWRVVTIVKRRMLRFSGCDGGERNVNKILKKKHRGSNHLEEIGGGIQILRKVVVMVGETGL